MIVSIEELMHLLSRLAEINKVPLESITWTSFGEPLEIPPKVLEDFRFVGLSNVAFIEMGFYKGQWKDEETDIWSL